MLRDHVTFTGELKKELMSLVNSHIGKALCPKDIHVVEDLPKTRNSKVMRRVIKATYLGKELGDLSSLVNPEVVPFIQGYSLVNYKVRKDLYINRDPFYVYKRKEVNLMKKKNFTISVKYVFSFNQNTILWNVYSM